MYDSTLSGSSVPADTLDFLNWACNESATSRPMDDAELERHYRERLHDDARCEASSIRPENMATDWLEAAVIDPAGNLPVASGESFADKLDDARRELARREFDRAYIVNVSVRGKRFAALVETPDGRKVKAGVHKFEADAWIAGNRLAARLRGEAAAVA